MIRPLWHPETVYLNTASFGLPPDPAWEALQQAQEDWRHGRVSWEHWTAVTDRARAEFATLTRSHPEHVVVGANVSGLISHVATALPDGSKVLAPEPEFTSLLFPFLAQAGRGVTRRRRPARQTRGSDRREHRRRRGLRGAVLDGRARRPGRDRRRGAPPRRPHDHRRHARDRLAPARRHPLRRGRLRRLQVADEPARHRVHGAQARPGGHAQPRPGRLVRRGEPADGPVRPAAAARAQRAPVRHLARRGSAGSAPSRR